GCRAIPCNAAEVAQPCPIADPAAGSMMAIATAMYSTPDTSLPHSYHSLILRERPDRPRSQHDPSSVTVRRRRQVCHREQGKNERLNRTHKNAQTHEGNRGENGHQHEEDADDHLF